MPIFTRPDAEIYYMFGRESVFSVSREFVRRCRTPLLLQPGSDKPHPAETSAEIAKLAPDLESQIGGATIWKSPEKGHSTMRRIA